MTTESPTIMVAIDDSLTRQSIVNELERSANLEVVADGESALRTLERIRPDLLLADIQFGSLDGLELLGRALLLHGNLPVVIIGPASRRDDALRGMKRGAYAYLLTPFHLDELQLLVNRALQQRGVERELVESRRRLRMTLGPDALVGDSTAQLRVLERVEFAALVEEPVLLTGEPGTGKSHTARVIHALSGRGHAPLVEVPLDALPGELIELRLMGDREGGRAGLLERAMGGTLLLEEVSAIPPELQERLVKGWRWLHPVTGGRPPVRLMATSRRDLDREMRRGNFNEQLFSMLSRVAIPLPPLRERTSDIPLLLDRFWQGAGTTEPPRLNAGAVATLMQQRWPENLHELRRLARELAGGAAGREVVPGDLPLTWRQGTAPGAPQSLVWEVGEEGLDFRAAVDAYQRYLLDQALARCDGERSAAARLLRLKRTTLVEKLKRLQQG